MLRTEAVFNPSSPIFIVALVEIRMTAHRENKYETVCN
jgi:hypothetical protein